MFVFCAWTWIQIKEEKETGIKEEEMSQYELENLVLAASGWTREAFEEHNRWIR